MRSEELGVRCEECESECKEYQQLEEKFQFLALYEETDRATSGQERTNDNVLLHFKI